MNLMFNELANDSRIWIYQSSKELTDDETKNISLELNEFINSWESHGKPVLSGYQIKYNRFIIIAADSSIDVSGCSIDSSVNFIQKLETKYKIELLDKMNVAYRSDSVIKVVSIKEFKSLVKDKSITESTIVFNNLVSNISEYDKYWEVNIKDSWHNQFLK